VVRYTIRRVLQSIPLLFGITVLTFLIIHAAPGGPLAFLTLDPNISPEDLERLKQAYGLNDPVPVQYLHWLGRLVHFDLGNSFEYHQPVLATILDHLPATLELLGVAYLIGIGAGIPLGVFAATHRGSLGDQSVRFFTVLGSAIPHWWLGLMLIVFLSGSVLHLFPAGGMGTVGEDFDLLDHLHHLFLPALILATGPMVVYARYVRAQTLEVLGQDYVRTARAKGNTERRIHTVHVLRNALIPAITLLGFSLAAIVEGAVLIEQVFAWPGMGRVLVQGALVRDYPLIMGGVLMAGFFVILGNLLADLGYGVADPRIRYR
jgi:peptide/nickel transport system permease protein